MRHPFTTTAMGLTRKEYAAAKQLPEDFLRGLGLEDVTNNGHPALRIPYPGADGQSSISKYRHALEGSNRFSWELHITTRLYGLDRLRRGEVVLVEGESDCHTLWLHGFNAVGVPGSAWNDEKDADALTACPRIYVVIEPDGGGRNLQRALERSALCGRIRIIRLDGFKDASELHLDDPNRFVERFRDAMAAATPLDASTRLAAVTDSDGVDWIGVEADGCWFIPEGDRNQGLFWLGRQFGLLGAEPVAVRAILHDLNADLCDPPLPGVEVDAIARSLGRWWRSWWDPRCKVQRAKRLIWRQIISGDSAVMEIQRLAAQSGIAAVTVARARRALNCALAKKGFRIRSRRVSDKGAGRGDGHWAWELRLLQTAREGRGSALEGVETALRLHPQSPLYLLNQGDHVVSESNTPYLAEDQDRSPGSNGTGPVQDLSPPSSTTTEAMTPGPDRATNGSGGTASPHGIDRGGPRADGYGEARVTAAPPDALRSAEFLRLSAPEHEHDPTISPKMTPLKGSLTREYRRCGKPRCRCNSGHRHGPYWRREWREHGQRRRQYIRSPDVAAVQEGIALYRRMHPPISSLRRRLARLSALSRSLEHDG